MRMFLGNQKHHDSIATFKKDNRIVTAAYYETIPVWTTSGYVNGTRWFVPAWNDKYTDTEFFGDPNEGEPVYDDDDSFGGTYATFHDDRELNEWMSARGFDRI